uniref:Uncharacterized protein n=1 Tax=Anopheles albimanus TaxID=7167 RepID=A0A182FL56_ANOAL
MRSFSVENPNGQSTQPGAELSGRITHETSPAARYGGSDRFASIDPIGESDREAAVMLSNSWLYHYYTVQSKMQFGIPFEGATRIPPQQQPQPPPAPLPPPPQSASQSYAAYTSSSSDLSPGAGSTSGGILPGVAMHGGYTTAPPPPQPHPHIAGYHGYHSPSGAGHHNGGTASPMLQGHQHNHHHANHHQHLQHSHQQQQQQQQQQPHHQQPGPSSASSAGEEYGVRGYGFRLESGTQPVDYSGGHPTPPTSAPPTPAMSGNGPHGAASALPIPVVQLTPHIRCHNGSGPSSAATPTSNHAEASGGSTGGSNNNPASDHRPPAKKRNRLEPLSIPDTSGQRPDSPETSTPLGDYHSGQSGSATGHMENGGMGPGDALHSMNGLDGTGALGSTSSGSNGGGGGGAMVIGTIASNRTTALGRLHAKSVILPPTVASLGGSEPTDFMEQWNPSPPWSDTTAQKVPDISHQELSPYMTTTPPTPTSAPHQMLNGGGFPTATTFSFDWMPEQFVPIVTTDCGVTTGIPHPGTIVTSQTVSGVSGGTLATLSGHGSGGSSVSSSSHVGHIGMVHPATTVGSVGCVLPPSCLTQDGLPIPGMSLPMVPVPLPIPPPPWPSDHRLLALDGTSTSHGMASAGSEPAEDRKPLDDSRTGHTGHEQH